MEEEEPKKILIHTQSFSWSSLSLSLSPHTIGLSKAFLSKNKKKSWFNFPQLNLEREEKKNQLGERERSCEGERQF